MYGVAVENKNKDTILDLTPEIKTEVELDEETLATINHLFDNNLNISETARQLFIHRNTLVYRLERIEKKLGLDIRTFEDAMLFKIAMMVRTHRNAIAQEAQSIVAK